ncbi:NGL2 [Candida margitis]|uniref:NGL2 n=1 Tax=Candida margitis TaxID=1775924 RepID=UPI0022276985|nr:NGL2 [Candida margitis]KAI5968079.1 NGL2 [Candida margitis]
MTKRKGTKKPVDPSKLTPQYIEEQRRIRNERKERERIDREARGLFDSPEPIEEFIKRPVLQVQPSNDDKLSIKIMSYNILAQCLIRRDLYPTNGKILKWSVRSKVLLEELLWYAPDILCLQECDKIQYLHFWQAELKNSGYDSKFYRYNTKNHGLVIAFKQDWFTCKHQSYIKYDQEFEYEPYEPKLPDQRIVTNNVGFMCFLEFKPSLVEQYPYLAERNGMIIGTTHAFWHPFGTYERTRQIYILLHKFKEFKRVLTSILGNKKPIYSFFTGDLNCEPFDAPYLSMTAKPVKYDGRAKNVLGCSLSYTFSKERTLDEDEHESSSSEEEEEEEEESGEGSQETEETDPDAARLNNPSDPEPEVFTPSEEQEKMIQQLEDAHNGLDIRAVSMYSAGYAIVHPENATEFRNEPSFSNWVEKWNGMLDYILLLVPWFKDKDYSNKLDSLQSLEEYNIKLTKLLKLPTANDMGPKPNGQPRLNQYPSDHLCIMAEIQLL